jgi:hypothetical protein
MNKTVSKYKSDFLFALYLIFFVSIVFSFRAVSSISIGLILMLGLFTNKPIAKAFSNRKGLLWFFISCCLLLALQSFSIVYTHNITEGVKLLERSSGIVIIPLAIVCSIDLLTYERKQKLLFSLTILLSVGSLYCIAVATINYFSGAPATVFFYHDLVKPLSQHAIQFSILVFIALLFLIKRLRENERSTVFSYLLTVFLSIDLLLLSSKLIISFYIIYLLFSFLSKRFYTKRNILLVSVPILAVAIIAFTSNPVESRFKEIFTGNGLLFEQKKFDQGVYFNGLQFRLLQWRFTYEILNEQHTWLAGLTPGDAQSYLDRKYIATNMYTGIPGTEKHGFLGYHTHNQFLQVTLENGLSALLVLLFMCYAFILMAREWKREELRWIIALLFIYCFTDVPLNTQYGIVLFAFFPVFFYLARPKHFPQDVVPDSKAITVNQRHSVEFAALKQPG